MSQNLSNAEIMNFVRSVASTEYVNRIPQATKTNLGSVGEAIETYPTTKNEFIDILTNQVARTIFFAKFFENPFKFFKKGSLPYGKTIEGLFVDLIQAKDFKEHFDASDGSDVKDLISHQDNDNVHVEYYSENFRHKYKMSISNSQLKGAFRDEYGLSNLVSQLLQAPLTSAENDEFLMMKKVLSKATVKETEISGYNTMSDNEKAKALTKAIKTYIGKFRFLSTEYNTQGVHTFSTPDDLVVLVTPETRAILDVELLSSAFNMSKADVESRVVLIDEFIKTDDSGADSDCLALICDKNLVQFYETENTSESFRNADRLETNIFFHRWGIMTSCNFVNAMKIKQPTSV